MPKNRTTPTHQIYMQVSTVHCPDFRHKCCDRNPKICLKWHFNALSWINSSCKMHRYYIITVTRCHRGIYRNTDIYFVRTHIFRAVRLARRLSTERHEIDTTCRWIVTSNLVCISTTLSMFAFRGRRASRSQCRGLKLCMQKN